MDSRKRIFKVSASPGPGKVPIALGWGVLGLGALGFGKRVLKDRATQRVALERMLANRNSKDSKRLYKVLRSNRGLLGFTAGGGLGSYVTHKYKDDRSAFNADQCCITFRFLT